MNTIDLFAGCGGLTEGFEQSGHFHTLAAIEWEKAPCTTLKNRLASKWGTLAPDTVLHFDIQRFDELMNGWDNDPVYGSSRGLNSMIQNKEVDVIIGGPPCQAYSLAGRIRDQHGMRDDYRNYLFESYIKVVDATRPKAFIFENVEGMLSAKPGGVPIIERIAKSFAEIGYFIPDNLRKDALVNVADYGVPQNRKRVFILGLNADFFGEKGIQKRINSFYSDYLHSHQVSSKKTVSEAINDLPKLFPIHASLGSHQEKTRQSHHSGSNSVPNHTPRFHSVRDQKIFSKLARDKKSNSPRFNTTEALKDLYFRETGKWSNVHKYYVLEEGGQSNTIPAHLHKDGLRHIHPDAEQARSITVREAARLQSFPDDFIFHGSRGAQYKMIGNAVPPEMARIVAISLNEFLNDNI